MKPVLVIYATREGHTRRIAEYLADAVRKRGLPADLVDASCLPAGFSLEGYSGALVAASVHRQNHEREMVDFVKRRAADLERIPSAFLSISLSEAGVEDPSASPERRAQAAADVEMMIQLFLRETAWRPRLVKPVAGALLYSKYNILLRFIMKLIARRAGGGTDTSRDYDYTDWAGLDKLVTDLVDLLTTRASSPESLGHFTRT